MVMKVAVVTGANKGIGLAIVKGLCERYDGLVYLTSRSDNRGKDAVRHLEKLGLHPKFYHLDVADRESVQEFSDHLRNTYGGIDILVNNAAVVDLIESSYEESKSIIDINYKSLLTIEELLFPLIRNNGRVLNISSDCGHLSNIKNEYWLQRLSRKSLTVDDINEFVEWFLEGKRTNTFDKKDIADGGYIAAYRVSKVAMSALTVVQQRNLISRNISVNSMHPGHVRTDMTWDLGFYNTNEAARTPIYLVLDAPQDLKGAYVWHDGIVMDWFDYNADIYFKRKDIKRHATFLKTIYLAFFVLGSYCKKRFYRMFSYLNRKNA